MHQEKEALILRLTRLQGVYTPTGIIQATSVYPLTLQRGQLMAQVAQQYWD